MRIGLSQFRTFISGIRGVTTGQRQRYTRPDRLGWPTRHDELVAPVQTRDQTDGHRQPSHPVAQACDV